MTTLVCQTLYTELTQEVFYGSRERLQIGCFSPYLLMMNSPVGTFNLEVIGTNGTVFSESFNSSDIKASIPTTDNYAHVFYPVIPTNPVQIEYGSFTIKLTASGYTPTNSSFLGWIQQHENIQNEMTFTPSNDAENSLAVRFKSYKEGIQ